MIDTGYLKTLIQSTRNRIVAIFSFAAYGGLSLDTPPAAFADLGGTFQTIDVYDADTLSTNRGITTSIANSSLSFDNPGVYALAIEIAFSHNSDNAGRSTDLRIFNIDDSVAIGSEIPVGVGRNQTETNFSITALVEVGLSNIGDEIVIQIGGGDTFTSVSFQSASYNAWNVGEFRGAF